jgi:hypothetical protein
VSGWNPAVSFPLDELCKPSNCQVETRDVVHKENNNIDSNNN